MAIPLRSEPLSLAVCSRAFWAYSLNTGEFITPIVSAVVVTSTGFSLLSVGAQSFGGGSGAPDFVSPENLTLGFVSLISCLVFQGLVKGNAKQLSVLFGLCVGYILALIMGKVDFSAFEGIGAFSMPQLMPFAPEFHPGAIIAVALSPVFFGFHLSWPESPLQ